MTPDQPQPSATVKSNKKGRVLILVLILAVLTGLYFVIFDWVVPKTAAFTIPHKWRMIPLRQTKDIVHNYFGEPLPNHTPESEEWANGSKGKMYFLKIYYFADTVATSYSIHYEYKNAISSRNYLVDSGSIK